jgi:hypothetical protein
MTTPDDILSRLPEAIRARAEKEANEAATAAYHAGASAEAIPVARDAVLARYAAAVDEADRRAAKAADEFIAPDARKAEADRTRAAFWAKWEAQSRPVERVTAEELAEVEGAPQPVTTSYTRAQLAVAVDEAHTALHEWVDAAGAPTPGEVDAINRAHEALHRVGAGQERIACATPDPEAQRLYADIRRMGEREMPCGHKVEDLVYGGPDLDGRPAVAQCGQCLADRLAWKAQQPKTPESVLRAMLRAYEQAALDAARAWWRSEDPDDADAHLAYEHALQAWSDVLLGLTMCLEGDAPDADDFMHTDIGQDYAARLRGDRPVDAPPAEV